LKIDFIQKGKARVLKQVFYKNITVPRGFVSDGASIPKIFWSIIGSPFVGLYLRASIIHDYLYSHQNYDYTRSQADKIFLEIMLNDGVSKTKAYTMYYIVRVFGRKYFKKKVN
jgi:hypothetical protein